MVASPVPQLRIVKEEDTPSYDTGATPAFTYRMVPDGVIALGNPYATHLYSVMLGIGKRSTTITASWNALATASGMNRKTVQKTLQFLESKGFITTANRAAGGRKISDVITLHSTPVMVRVADQQPDPVVPLADQSMVRAADHGGPSRGPLNGDVTTEKLRDILLGEPNDEQPENDGSTPSEQSMTNDKRKTRIAEDTVLSEDWSNAAKGLGIEHDVQWQFDAFMDHHIAKGSLFVDWRRAWQTWCRNAVSMSRRGPVSQARQSQADPIAAARAERDRLSRREWANHIERQTYGLGGVCDDQLQRRIAELDRIIAGEAAA